MKLSVNRTELAEAMAVVGSVVAPRTPKPILQCALLEGHDDYGLLATTDLEIGVRFTVGQIEVERTGSVLVSAEKLTQIVRESSADESLMIEVKDNICHVRGADSHFQIYAQDPAEFPRVPQAEGEPDLEVQVDDLRRAAEWTVFAAARENTRYAINGVLWEKSGNRLTLVATDGRRLSRAVQQLDATDGRECSGIVPIKAMSVISRLLPDGSARAAVKITGNQMLLSVPRATVSSALVEGHFPKYEDVIPNDCDKSVEFDVQELLRAVRRAALLTNEESRGVRLSFQEGMLQLSSRAPEEGEAVVSLPVSYKGPPMDVAFNPVFLTDILRVAPSDKVIFEFSQPNRPGLFRVGEAFLYVVMPVNLS